MITHSAWLPHSQETFLNDFCKDRFLKEIIQTLSIGSVIIIESLLQNMSSSFSYDSIPEKGIPGKKQSFNISFSILQFRNWHFLLDWDESLFNHSKQLSDHAIESKKDLIRQSAVKNKLYYEKRNESTCQDWKDHYKCHAESSLREKHYKKSFWIHPGE